MTDIIHHAANHHKKKSKRVKVRKSQARAVSSRLIRENIQTKFDEELRDAVYSLAPVRRTLRAAPKARVCGITEEEESMDTNSSIKVVSSRCNRGARRRVYKPRVQNAGGEQVKEGTATDIVMALGMISAALPVVWGAAALPPVMGQAVLQIAAGAACTVIGDKVRDSYQRQNDQSRAQEHGRDIENYTRAVSERISYLRHGSRQEKERTIAQVSKRAVGGWDRPQKVSDGGRLFKVRDGGRLMNGGDPGRDTHDDDRVFQSMTIGIEILNADGTVRDRVRAIADTGASNDLVAKAKLDPDTTRGTLQPSKARNLHSASASRLNSEGAVCLRFRMQGAGKHIFEHETQCMTISKVPPILGIPFWHKYKARVCLETRTINMELMGNRITIRCAIEQDDIQPWEDQVALQDTYVPEDSVLRIKTRTRRAQHLFQSDVY